MGQREGRVGKERGRERGEVLMKTRKGAFRMQRARPRRTPMCAAMQTAQPGASISCPTTATAADARTLARHQPPAPMVSAVSPHPTFGLPSSVHGSFTTLYFILIIKTYVINVSFLTLTILLPYHVLLGLIIVLLHLLSCKHPNPKLNS